jgi:hypothetical protein
MAGVPRAPEAHSPSRERAHWAVLSAELATPARGASPNPGASRAESSSKRMKGFEPSTFAMARRRSARAV